MNRVSIYIDGGAFIDGLRGQGMSIDIDWDTFLDELVPHGQRQAVHFFAAALPEHPYPAKQRNHQAYLEKLKFAGFNVHVGWTQVVASQFIERGVEVQLATQLVTDAHADTFDTALIISRRADLCFPLRKVREAGKRVEVAFFHYAIQPHNELHEAADAHQVISCAQIVNHTVSGPVPYFI